MMPDLQVVKAWLASKQGFDSSEAIQPKVLALAAVVMEQEQRLAELEAYLKHLQDVDFMSAPKGKKSK